MPVYGVFTWVNCLVERSACLAFGASSDVCFIKFECLTGVEVVRPYSDCVPLLYYVQLWFVGIYLIPFFQFIAMDAILNNLNDESSN